MKIAFFWTWEFSKNILKDIINFKDIEVCLAVSNTDKIIWRKKELKKTPVKILAEQENIICLQPEKLKDNKKILEELKKLNLDFIVIVAYSKIIPKNILEIPKYFCVNIHWSILPNYRWASPIQESIKNWDKKTWLTIMQVNENMDEGNILKIQELNIRENNKTPDIFKKFEEIWAKLLLEVLKWIITWKITWIPQNNNKANYCHKISKKDWEINFFKNWAREIYNKFRAYFTRPWVYTFYKNKKLNIEDCFIDTSIVSTKNSKIAQVVKIDKKNIWIVCADYKILVLKEVRLEWKKNMSIIDFTNGNKDFVWNILSN